MKLFRSILWAAIAVFIISSCEDDNNAKNTLTSSQQLINVAADGGNYEITITTDAQTWKIDNPSSDWVNLTKSNGLKGETTVTVFVDTRTLNNRTATLTVTAGNATPLTITVTQTSSDYLYTLTSDVSSLATDYVGSSGYFRITTTAPEWTASEDADWITLDKTTASYSATIKATTTLNTSKTDRSATITISAANTTSITITVTQPGTMYPSYNTSPIAADNTGMTSTAIQLVKNIHLGWNLGNTLEAIGGETTWGNPLTTKAMIDCVKANGFDAVRIPCSWNQYMENSKTAQLKTSWLNHVKEVVQYCTDNNMYVLLNIHWDGGWLQENCTVAKQEENNAKQKAFWEQIATHLRDFDEHLMFASANEPNVTNATEMSVLSSYHQTFVDAVRSTGGKNAYRVLVVQGPSTDIEKTNNLMTSMPTDQIPNKLIAEIHYYTPWNFCGLEADASWGKMCYYWGSGYHSTTDLTRNATSYEESAVDTYFGQMKTKFVDKGIPVIMGEYGVVRRTSLTGAALTLHLNSRAYYMGYVTQKAKENGLVPFWWDTGSTDVNNMTMINRKTLQVYDQQALDSLKAGAAAGIYPY